ncbi:MAG: WYL domain-containing protein [Actinobacteria bacterium]|nr:WYL domain-containing protein [Actinomycetota bacterium]
MSSAKTERLVNLTMALLGTKRYMAKSEIFKRVSGYTGTQETKERMFERDKDDLRNLGIEIEVATHDPLFEDEVGYRIRPEAFQIHEKFSAEELGLISLALQQIEGDDFSGTARSLALRLNSLAVTPEIPVEIPVAQSAISEAGLSEVLSALSERATISFDYQKASSNKSEERKVNPLGVSAWRGAWYLVGEDLERDDIRAFKLSRISSGISRISKAGAYQVPSDFNIKEYLVMLKSWDYVAKIAIRKSAGIHLRNRAISTSEIDDEWDEVELTFSDEAHALREALWLADDTKVLSPSSLKGLLIEKLKRLVLVHG